MTQLVLGLVLLRSLVVIAEVKCNIYWCIWGKEAEILYILKLLVSIVLHVILMVL